MMALELCSEAKSWLIKRGFEPASTEEFKESVSPVRSLQVGNLPYGDILDFRVPIAARIGDPIDIAILVKNTGDLTGNFHVTIWSGRGGSLIWESEYVDIGAGGQYWFYGQPITTMPNHDLTLLAESRHNHIIDEDSEKIVPLIVPVDTALTLTLTPTLISPGGTYTYNGRLTRADTGAGLAGQSIILQRNGSEVGRVTTGSDGVYSGNVIAPTTVGSYNCKSIYQGNILLGYGASMRQATLTIGVSPPIPWGTIIVVGTFLGGLVFLLKRRGL